MIKDYKQCAMFMKALSDETRVKIYSMLAQGELCACKILEEFNITQPTLSYHMKIMIDSGLVVSRRDGVWIRYSICSDKLQAIIEMFNGVREVIDSSSQIKRR